MSIVRILNYQINEEYNEKTILSFLKDKGYPDSSLTALRKRMGLILFNDIPVPITHSMHLSDGENNLTISIEETNSSLKILPVKLDFEIVYEDDDILVINKPANMPIHPSMNNYENSLANGLAYYFKEKNLPFVFRCINRLDKDTTGLTIIAKHALSAGKLSYQMQKRAIKREYTAIVSGINLKKEGTIDLPIARVNDSLITREVNVENGETAITHYRLIEEFPTENLSLVKLRLETGRTHQIRVHMKAIGHPLIGDYLYNPTDKTMDRQALHAGSISFVHPISDESMSFNVDMPSDMRSVLPSYKTLNT